jgi:hypothetical protein
MESLPKITPSSYAPHQIFQDEIQDLFVSKGFEVIRFTYHDLLPRDQISRLGRNNSLAALYIRTHTDLLGVAYGDKYSCLVEIKSSENQRFRNMSIEAYPFGVNSVLASVCGVDIYYFWKDFITGRSVGFHAGNHPKIDRIIIPDWRWNDEEIASWKTILRGLFQDTPLVVKQTGRHGSGDPMVIITESELVSLLSPNDVLESILVDAEV